MASARFFVGRLRRSSHRIWIGSHVQQRRSGMRKGTLNRRSEICLVLDAFGVETDGSCDGAEIRVLHFGAPEGVPTDQHFQPDHSQR